MRLCTFNVNSARKRMPHLRRLIERHSPDLIFLQELKCKTEEFPGMEVADLGYQVHAVGQPGGRNGVAVVARIPFEVVDEALPDGEDDTHARFVEVKAGGMNIAGIYLPNGNSGGDAGYAYKLAWMARLRARVAERLDSLTPYAVLGDFNVCPTDEDFSPGALPPTDALVRPESRAALRAITHLGMMDALRALHPADAPWTYWDYGPAFEQNRGLRIDHALLSAELAERLTGAFVDLAARSEETPSDHAPVLFDLAD
ncbi:exodeoxyribonuclease III [Pararoseomonas indoligenes]|uniref:Endonuclease/exonuclease/phosphatase family protein n=1 Tax=Roseomonas indoligenes TaxID=2820811 RepID=A0A940MYL1_9PROT|nr:exodeoxyribonuclease III [Pararoseomonas indoligenes]MBP0492826.1 endonuclease/exonuclease/phosphatase family protein [Pararoseomonas indoligenes]